VRWRLGFEPIDDGLDGIAYLDLPVENELSNDGGGGEQTRLCGKLLRLKWG
jgi:hypothetical protein